MLAIIIPFYKIAFFETTLQSLSEQTDKRFKVYIFDDASPDDCTILLERFIEKFDYVYHRFENNFGKASLIKQWDRCIEHTDDEEWIMILGDDDSLGSKCVELFYKNIEEISYNKCKVVRFSSKIFYQNTSKTSKIYSHPKIEKVSDFYYRRFTNKTRSSLSEYVFLRSSYVTNGFVNYDLGWHTDDRAWIDFTDFGSIFSINEDFVSVGLSDLNISRGEYGIAQKNEMSYKFHSYVLSRYFFNFKRSQLRKLFIMYEQVVYNSKKGEVFFLIKMLLAYNTILYPLESVKFLRRYFLRNWK